MSDADLCGVKTKAYQCLHVIDKYSWLLDAFVLEFFTEQHWKQMPKCWQSFLASIEPEELGHWISASKETRCTKVWPLSLMALHSVVQLSMLPRQLSKSNTCENINLNSSFDWLDQNLQEVQLEKSPTEQHNETCSEEMDNFELKTTETIGKTVRDIIPGEPTQCVTNPSLKNLFIKHVRPKKRHEIVAIAKIFSKIAQQVECKYVVDVGAGKGHLSRLLSYGYGLNVCCLEAQSDLTWTARKLDEELEYTARKYLGAEYVAALPTPTHINLMLNTQNNPKEFVNKLREAFGLQEGSPFTFGLVGLHPCGDLAPTLLHLFSACEEAKFISVVGCCYMKLTLKPNPTKNPGSYPLSSYFRSLPPQLTSQSYEALEIACHALEEYSLRLQQSKYSDLKIHSYRAVLEQIIVGLYPEKRRLGLRSIKQAHNMDFAEYVGFQVVRLAPQLGFGRTSEHFILRVFLLFSSVESFCIAVLFLLIRYAKVAVSRVGVILAEEVLSNADIQKSLASWKQVVVFYSLRLLVAPLVETAVLLDRLLFLGEQGSFSANTRSFHVDTAVDVRWLLDLLGLCIKCLYK